MTDSLQDLLCAVRHYVHTYLPNEQAVAVAIRLGSGQVVRHPLPCPETARERHHSPDFRTVLWDGQRHHLTGMQAAVVKLLWDSWQQGVPELSAEAILESVDSTGRLPSLFARSSAWGSLIVRGKRRNTFRLNDTPK